MFSRIRALGELLTTRLARSLRGDRFQGKLRPMRELFGEQPAHERYVDIQVVDVHLAMGHDRPIA